jgi:UDP-glucose 4-epimerase
VKTALITGAHGFLGRNVAAIFHQAGYEVYGLGIGTWSGEAPEDFGISRWHETAITLETLRTVSCRPDVLVHCAGSGSVGFSLSNPLEDFQMTVDTTASVLEYLRKSAPHARMVYPSSAAVYGCRHNGLLEETFQPDPVSPYGVHKLMAEQLCLSAARNFDIDCRIVRFFSLYGPGLRKQLLWDAARRLVEAGDEAVEFFGTGQETRDWLHVRDAATLMLTLAEHELPPAIVNGASGDVRSVEDMLVSLRDALASDAQITFNNQVREGDPQHLQAEIHLVAELGWQPKVSSAEGLEEYAGWFKSLKK